MNSHNPRFAPWRAAALVSALMLGGAFVASPVLAASSADSQDVLTVQSQSGVSYLNGGIGDDEQVQMRGDARKWPLRMTFSEGDAGAYVADAEVKITGKGGKTVFTLSGAGPLTYVKLSPGEYRVVVTHGGKSLSRSTRVGRKSTDLNFHW